MRTVNELRDYYDNTDMSEAIDESVREEPVDEVLVSTSIRLTKAIMDRCVPTPTSPACQQHIDAPVDHGPGGRIAGSFSGHRFRS
jgi:hypothetical protein